MKTQDETQSGQVTHSRQILAPQKQNQDGIRSLLSVFSIPIPLQGSSLNIYIHPVNGERFGLYYTSERGRPVGFTSPILLRGSLNISIRTVQTFELYYSSERGHPAASVAAPPFRRSLNIVQHCTHIYCCRHPLLLVANWRGWILLLGHPPLFLSDITLDSIPWAVGRVGF